MAFSENPKHYYAKLVPEAFGDAKALTEGEGKYWQTGNVITDVNHGVEPWTYQCGCNANTYLVFILQLLHAKLTLSSVDITIATCQGNTCLVLLLQLLHAMLNANTYLVLLLQLLHAKKTL